MENEVPKKKPGRPAKSVQQEATAVRPDKDNRAKRPRRSPVGGPGSRQRLGVVGKEEGYHYRWVNDEGSRIAEFEEYGYDVDRSKDINVSSISSIKTGSAHSVVVDKKSGQKGVLMRQPIEFHEEDKGLKAKAIDKSEESMYRQLKSEDGRYGSVDKSDNLSRKVDD